MYFSGLAARLRADPAQDRIPVGPAISNRHDINAGSIFVSRVKGV
jgi:hypothetical protein